MTCASERRDLAQKAALREDDARLRTERIERQLRLCIDSGERPVLREIASGLGVGTSVVSAVWRALGGGSLVRAAGRRSRSAWVLR